MSGPVIQKRFQKTSTVSNERSSNDRKVVGKRKSTVFDIFGNSRKFKENLIG